MPRPLIQLAGLTNVYTPDLHHIHPLIVLSPRECSLSMRTFSRNSSKYVVPLPFNVPSETASQTCTLVGKAVADAGRF